MGHAGPLLLLLEGRGLVAGAELGAGRVTAGRVRCQEMQLGVSLRAIGAVDLHNVCLEGCGGGDSFSFLAKILLWAGLAPAPLARGVLQPLQNKQVS